MEDQGFEFDEGIKPLYDLRILKHELFVRNVSDIDRCMLRGVFFMPGSLYFFCIFTIFKCRRKTRQRNACLFSFSYNLKYRKTCFTLVVFHE